MRIELQIGGDGEASGEQMQITVHLRGGEEIEFCTNPEEWFEAFDRAHRRRRGIQIVDSNHGGKLGINPQHVLYWTARPSAD